MPLVQPRLSRSQLTRKHSRLGSEQRLSIIHPLGIFQKIEMLEAQQGMATGAQRCKSGTEVQHQQLAGQPLAFACVPSNHVVAGARGGTVRSQSRFQNPEKEASFKVQWIGNPVVTDNRLIWLAPPSYVSWTEQTAQSEAAALNHSHGRLVPYIQCNMEPGPLLFLAVL